MLSSMYLHSINFICIVIQDYYLYFKSFYLIIFYNHGGDKMDMKKIIFVLIISTLFMGCAFAANSINDLKVDEKYKHEAGNDCFSLNLNDNKDTGCVIFKNVNDDAYDKISDSYGNFIQDDGRDYIKHDDDMKIDKNPDNTANFTDMDHSTHGVVELVESNGQQYIVVFLAKNSANIQNSDLASQLAQFNTNNQVKPVAF